VVHTRRVAFKLELAKKINNIGDGGGTKQTERNCTGIGYQVEFRVSSMQSAASDGMEKHRPRQHRTKHPFINKIITTMKKKRKPRKKKRRT